jgi:AcrR family transcriptional regulator
MAIATRRIGAESSATRAAMLGAAEALMRDEGYAAVSTRKVAGRAGLKPSLVHYYFPTTDDLLIALFRRGADQSDAMLEEALSAADPLRALWEFFADTSRTALTLEFMALANHRKALRTFMVEHSDQMRARQVEMIRGLPALEGTPLADCPPAALSLLLAGIGRVLVMEGGMGVVSGHAEARAFVEQWLERLAAGGVLQDG